MEKLVNIMNEMAEVLSIVKRVNTHALNDYEYVQISSLFNDKKI